MLRVQNLNIVFVIGRMKSVVMLLLFIGTLLIVHTIYEQKLAEAKKQRKIEYRFIPRTLYDEQVGEPTVSNNFAPMFAKAV